MNEPRRGLDLPSIPADEFVPRPPRLTDRSAEWGVTIRTWFGTQHQTETVSPEDIIVNGVPVTWHPADNGTGVLLGRATGPFGVSLAIARAVPLS
jgi:hypothetical protein